MVVENKLFYLMRRTWRHAGDKRQGIVLFYAMFIIANIILAFQPVVLSKIIDVAQKGGPDALHQALWWSAAYGGVTFFFWIFHGPARVMERRIGFIVFKNFVTSLYRTVTEMPFRWHQDHHSGNTINRVNKAGRALFNFAQSQFVIIQTVVKFSVSLMILVWFSWWVALASFIVSVIIAFIIRRFDKALIPLVLKNNEHEHHLNAGLYDYIGNIVTVLTLRLQRNTVNEIDGRFGVMKSTFWRETAINEGKWAAVNLILIATQACIVGIYIALHMWRGEELALGAVVAIFQYLLMIMQYFYSSMVIYEELTYRQLDVRGVDNLLADHVRLVTDRRVDETRPWREIHISNLTFTHKDGEDEFHTLRDVELRILARQKVALIGQSGSGKTTLLTLMRGLYEAQQVKLAVDDAEFNELTPLSSFTTLVPQDSEIFENTIRHNLTLGTDVTDATIKQALSITTFDEVVTKLPQGVWTDIRERGVNLSGGQKQRLALARGLVAARDSSLLLLDEPTSSVDLPTEAVIFDRLFSIFADKAIIASIHRLHLLPRFDYICFMKDGVIAEQGSFTELHARKGEFSKLWQHHLSQAGTKQ